MTITTEQRERRKRGIGGSDAPAILGLSPWATPLKVWLSKKGELPEDEPNMPMMLGNALEPFIAQQWSRRTGLEVYETETLVHPDHPWMIGHPDRMLYGCSEGLECKLVVNRQDDWGPPDSDLVPPYVYIQVAHYMAVTNCTRWHVAAMFGLRELRCYTIERNEGILQKLFEKEREFWQMVLDDVRPPMMSLSDIDALYPNDMGTAITADVTVMEALNVLRYARGEADTWTDLEGVAEAQVKAFMGENGVLTDDMGTPLATWKKTKDGAKFNADKFRTAYPGLWKQFLEPTKGSRRFLIK